jgi:ribosomal protein S18 acetylase RimI-like enzyme
MGIVDIEGDCVTVLRPITEAEYVAWLEIVIPAYAKDKVSSGQWPKDSALDSARKDYAELLPNGRDTDKNHIFTVLSPEGFPVGTLWFVEQERANSRIAYVYDIYVKPEHRRQGHASRAFQALEVEVTRLRLSGVALHVFGHNLAAQALYTKLGYVATNINMFKPVSGAT